MQTGVFDVSKSSYYQFYLREVEQINLNRWYLSEKAGHDVGYEYAQWDWCMRFRSKWIAEQKAAGKWVT